METIKKTPLIEIVKPDFTFEDERGLICQIAHGDIAQVNCVFSKAGAVRGRFHYHKRAKEQFYVARGKLRLELYGEDKQEEYIFETGQCFLIPAKVRHNFTYLEDTLLVSMYDKRVELDDNTKDIFND